MAKKQKKVEAEVAAVESEKQAQISEGVVSESVVDPKMTAKEQEKELKKRQKEEKLAQKEKDSKNKETKKKQKNKEKKGGLIKKSKETVSELKKVTWPTFGDVVKKTSVVVAFVVIAGVFLYGVNILLGWLVGLLV